MATTEAAAFRTLTNTPATWGAGRDSSSTGGSAIHSCDFTDGGQSCDFGCEHTIAGDYHSGTEGANNECDGDECEPVVDCGFLNCGR